tara:strand:- start:404 stop:760 length:357 start_codon:yes stop_codon:yes gene_type:complete
MKILILLFFCFIIIFFFIKIRNFSTKNKKLLNFKNSFKNKLNPIEKIYLRNEERATLNPEMNLDIGIYDSEKEISTKVNIHRARLAKFKKSKLNGELIFKNNDGKLYKLVDGMKLFLD